MLLASLKTLGLVLLTGPFLFARIITITGIETDVSGFIKSKLKIPLAISAVVYLLSIIMEEFVFTSRGPGLEVLNILSGVLIMLVLYKPAWLTEKLSTNLVVIFGLIMIAVHAFASQSGYEAGIYPFLALTFHIAAVALWAGGLWVVLILRSDASGATEDNSPPHQKRVEYRFFQTTLVLLVLLLVSGAVLMTSNVHDIAVTEFTKYGRYLDIKLYLVGIIIVFALIKILRLNDLFAPVENDHKSKITTGIPLANSINSALLLFTIICSALLTRLEPPNIAPFINPQTWQLSISEQDVRIEMQPVAGSAIDIRFEVFFPEQLMQMQPLSIDFDLYLLNTQTGIYGAEAIQVSQNSYQGEASLPVPGDWQLDLDIKISDGSILTGNQSFMLPSQPLVEDIRTYLSGSAITYSISNTITFLVGIGIILIYTWLTRRGISRQPSPSLALAGLAGLGLGIYLVMSVVLVKTYPSTYWKNPQSYSFDTINQGRVNFVEHCAECHGDTGAGDGPWAIENRGKIPDLAAPHMDVHTDGELYWWNARGIPSLDMPPLGNEISETDNWNIIYYIRSLRHGVP